MAEFGVTLSSDAEAAAAALKLAADNFAQTTQQLVADLDGHTIVAGGDVGARLATALDQAEPVLKSAVTGTANNAAAGAFGEKAVGELRRVDGLASRHFRT